MKAKLKQHWNVKIEIPIKKVQSIVDDIDYFNDIRPDKAIDFHGDIIELRDTLLKQLNEAKTCHILEDEE
jgi:hypothetical protein